MNRSGLTIDGEPAPLTLPQSKRPDPAALLELGDATIRAAVAADAIRNLDDRLSAQR